MAAAALMGRATVAALPRPETRTGDIRGTTGTAGMTDAIVKRHRDGDTTMSSHSIAVMGGDGIGVEVVEAGVHVLQALAEIEPGLSFAFERFDWGSDYYRRNGRMMPADGLAQLEGFDAIYFGAVGDPDLPDDVTLWGLRLAICQGFDQYANVRPTRRCPA